MTIKLEWRFGLLKRLGEVHMKELMDFYRQAEEHFRVAIETWEAEINGLTEEQDAMYSDYLTERRDSIESLMDRGHTMGIVALYTFLERFLNLVVERLRSGGAPIPESNQGFSLHKLRDSLLQHAQINMGRTPFDWSALERLREVRNCIVHTDGWITDDFVTRLGAVGLTVKEDTRLELPKGYFEHTWALVNQTYQLVHSECWKRFGYGKQEEIRLRPTRRFTSEELRQILEEATAAGIIARERETKRLLQMAKDEGSKQEDSCGWVWLILDHKLLQHIHKLNISNVSTSYNTMAIVEDFKLHLKDVSDYQRMSASLRGIEAAAAVLEKHGIRSRVGSMAD